MDDRFMSGERIYNKHEVVSFARTRGHYGGLSNMSQEYVMFVNEIPIHSVEALYQACKYPLYPEIQEEIIAENNPMEAKRISRKYHQYIRQDWDEIKFKVMEWCLTVKLTQNWERFGELLKSTQNATIVEYSSKDNIWGAMPSGRDELVGINAMGRLLMKLREEYVQTNRRPQFVIPPQITGFLFMGMPITKVYPAEYYLEDFG